MDQIESGPRSQAHLPVRHGIARQVTGNMRISQARVTEITMQAKEVL